MESTPTQAVNAAVPVTPEDRARADMYALIASLFYGPPEAKLLAAIAQAARLSDEPDSPLAEAWRELQMAAARADPEAVRDEYDRLFVSVGQAPVMLYGSYHLAGFLHELPLVDLRDELARLGFMRRTGTAEPEDHLSALCDVMRMLITEGEEGAAGLQAQRDFFGRFVRPWYERLMAEIAKAQGADFYQAVGRFAQAYLDVETRSFAIEL